MLVKEYTLVGGFELFPNAIIIPLTVDEKESCKKCGTPTYQIQYLSKGRFGTGIAIGTVCPVCDELQKFWEDFQNDVNNLDEKNCAVCKKKGVLIDNLCRDCHPYPPPEEYWEE